MALYSSDTALTLSEETIESRSETGASAQRAMLSCRKGVLFLLPGLYPCVTAGIEIFHFYFVQALAAHYNIFVATHCDRLGHLQDVRILHHPSTLLNSHTTALAFHHTRFFFEFRHRIHLIHLPYSSKAVVQNYHVLLARRLFNIPYILRIHGGGLHPAKPFRFHQLLFDKAAAVIAVSTPVKEEFEARHGRRIDMIPSMLPFLSSGLNRTAARDKWGLNDTDFVILFVGSIKSIKGPDLLLDAFFDLGLDFIETHGLRLVYAGDGAMKPELERKALASPLADRVHLLGRVPHEQVCELYGLADIFCIPSLMEARPLALAEALYNGLPSIGSDIPTICNIITHEETGLLFETRNRDSLVSRLKRFVEDEPFRRRIGESARISYRSFFNYDKMIRDYCRVYDRVIAMNPRGRQAI